MKSPRPDLNPLEIERRDSSVSDPKTELTPMRRQYNAIKEQNSDCILFFRLGEDRKSVV